jgi:ribose transport system permease protein
MVRNASFVLRKGEILGFAGLMGAGRTELARAVFGADPIDAGEILVRGKKVSIKSPEDAVSHGIGYLSEDRKHFGLATGMDVETNIALPSMKKFLSMGVFIDQAAIEAAGERYVKQLNIKTPSVRQQVRLLSGGNQQKIVIAKWLLRDCSVLFFDEPTRGIDVGAKAEIYRLLNALAEQGKAIVIISSELPEILRVSHRVLVMCEGRITGELAGREASQEKIMQLATRREAAATDRMTTTGDIPLTTPTATTAATAPPGFSLKARLFRPATRQKLLAFASLVVLMVFFSFASPQFLQTDNLVSILQSTAVNGVLAIACTFVIITAGIDLSVGTLMTFCAVMAGVVLTYMGMPLALGIAAAIFFGALAGFVSGVLIAKLKIPPFIATLGMMMLLKGLSLVISGTKPIYFNDTPDFPAISQDSLIGYFIPSLPIPNAVLILFVVAIAASIVLNKTILGRYTFALGSNEEAVRLSGVNTDFWKVVVYTVSGGICGIAGLLIASRLNSAQPALGQGYELDAIAAVVIGGTSLSGGTGTIVGTIIGAFIMSVLINGLRILSVAQEWQTVITGVIHHSGRVRGHPAPARRSKH